MVAARFESCVQADEFLSPSRLGMKGKSAQANFRLNMKRRFPVLKQRKDFFSNPEEIDARRSQRLPFKF